MCNEQSGGHLKYNPITADEITKTGESSQITLIVFYHERCPLVGVVAPGRKGGARMNSDSTVRRLGAAQRLAVGLSVCVSARLTLPGLVVNPTGSDPSRFNGSVRVNMGCWCPKQLI